MTNKQFYITLAVIIAIGLISLCALIGYSYKLKENASIISIITTERW